MSEWWVSEWVSEWVWRCDMCACQRVCVERECVCVCARTHLVFCCSNVFFQPWAGRQCESSKQTPALWSPPSVWTHTHTHSLTVLTVSLCQYWPTCSVTFDLTSPHPPSNTVRKPHTVWTHTTQHMDIAVKRSGMLIISHNSSWQGGLNIHIRCIMRHTLWRRNQPAVIWAE